MYEYRATIIKIIDGDTVDVDIDLGFNVVLRDERVRIAGIDTPESRTRNLEEKKCETFRGWCCTMITAINFGGLSKPAPKPKPIIAPLPEEYNQPSPNQTIKNHSPKPQ